MMNENNKKTSESNLQRIENIQKDISKLDTLRIRASERRNALRPQYKEKLKEIKELGFDPQNIEAEMAEKQKSIEAKLEQISELLPLDIIDKLQEYGNDIIEEKNEEKPNDENMSF